MSGLMKLYCCPIIRESGYLTDSITITLKQRTLKCEGLKEAGKVKVRKGPTTVAPRKKNSVDLSQGNKSKDEDR